MQGDVVVGAIVFKITREGFYLDNVSARPLVKGIGVGRQLLEFAEAEARRQWRTSIFLATHELRTCPHKKSPHLRAFLLQLIARCRDYSRVNFLSMILILSPILYAVAEL